ncbi:VOC family protein, partial [Listeria monocytogenes]|nr:VOC family protein [Listeria monocytogenes]
EIPATNSNPTIHTNIPAEKQLVRIIGADYHVPDPAATSRFFTNLFELESQDGVLVDKSEMSFAKLHATTSDKKSRTGRGTIDHIAYTLETKEAVDELHDLAVRNDLKIE